LKSRNRYSVVFGLEDPNIGFKNAFINSGVDK